MYLNVLRANSIPMSDSIILVGILQTAQIFDYNSMFVSDSSLSNSFTFVFNEIEISYGIDGY